METPKKLQGLVTEDDFHDAENEFPGIERFYVACIRKPTTFLELLWRYKSGLLG